MLSFYQQQSYLSQIVSKKSQNNNIIFYEKFQNNIILGFMYLVSVYQTNRTIIHSVPEQI